MKKKDRCYVIIDKNSKMLYGAFPWTEEGEKDAKKYLRKIKRNNNLEIVER